MHKDGGAAPGGGLLAKPSSCLGARAGGTVICRPCCSEPQHAWLSRGACRPSWWVIRQSVHACACAADTYLTAAHHHAQVKRALMSAWTVPSHHVRRMGQDNGGAKPACLRLFCDARRGGSGQGGKPPREHVSRCVHAYFDGQGVLGVVLAETRMHACMYVLMHVCMNKYVCTYVCTYACSACEYCMDPHLGVLGICSFL